MLIGDDEAHPAEPTGLERAEEAAPEHFVLAVADVEAEDLTGSRRR